MQRQEELRTLREQRLELARLITVLQQQREQKETTETTTVGLGEITEPTTPPLTALLDALHIEPPRFATPEKEDDITSTPPASPMEQINHLVLCTTSNDAFIPDEQNKQVYTSDDDTRTHAPMQTTNKSVYIPKRKSMHVRVYLHMCKKREEECTLLDSGATENFMHLPYVQWLK